MSEATDDDLRRIALQYAASNYGFEFFEVQRIERAGIIGGLARVHVDAWNGPEKIERLATEGDPAHAEGRRRLAALRSTVVLAIGNGVVVEEEWLGIDF